MTEWTNWVDHDGLGFPTTIKAGMIVQAELVVPSDNMRFLGRKTGLITQQDIDEFEDTSWWLPCPAPFAYIKSYRIQKPKALQQLIEQIRDIDLSDEDEQIKELEKIASFANSEEGSPF